MTIPLNFLQLIIEESLLYRGLLFLWRIFSASVEESLVAGLCRKSGRRLQKWSRGSLAVELLWRREYRSPWQSSLFRGLLRCLAALLRRALHSSRELWEASRRDSLAAALYSRGKSSLESSPVTMLADLLLAFVAVSMALRQALGAPRTLYLLLGAVSLTLLVVLRLHSAPVARAWPESLFYRLVSWLFSLDPQEKRRL